MKGVILESNGTYSSMGSGMLGLEMSLHHVPPQQNPHPPTVSYITTHDDVDHRQQSQRGGNYPPGNKPKTTQGFTLSDDDEGPTPDQNSADDDGKTKMCQWQRMKWTDNMVRLLIMVVYYIGDEVGSEGNNNNNNDPGGNNKKKGGGVMQKKGKWKSVSRAMMERGFYVSPQQCEDKFNDLNKRYKRVNDIIGKGTACKVVENQSLLEKMDYLSAKMKEEVKKLLNSKHLFFREMCAYHSTCGHGSAATAADGGSEPSSQANNQQQRCLHSSENVRMGTNLGREEVEGTKNFKLGSGEEENEDEDSEEDDDEDGSRRQDQAHDSIDDDRSRKRARETTECRSLLTMMQQQLTEEITNVCEDGTRSPLEKRRWIKARAMQLEEQCVEYQCEAFELEKQRLKWKKFSSKKEREMEREKIMNERKKLENERMVVMLHKKEIEFIHGVHHQRTSDPSSVTG